MRYTTVLGSSKTVVPFVSETLTTCHLLVTYSELGG